MAQFRFYLLYHIQNIRFVVEVMRLKVHLHFCITDNFSRVDINLDVDVGLYIPEACELIEMSPECIPRVIEGLVACTDEAAAFDEIMPLVERGCGKIFVDWMDLKLLEGVDGSDGVLPHVAYDVVEIARFEHIDGVG